MCGALLPGLSFQIIMSGLPSQITMEVTLIQVIHCHRGKGACSHTQSHSTVFKMAGKVQAPTVQRQSKEQTPTVQLQIKKQASMVQLQSKEQAPTVQLQQYLLKHVKVHSSRHGDQRLQIQ